MNFINLYLKKNIDPVKNLKKETMICKKCHLEFFEHISNGIFFCSKCAITVGNIYNSLELSYQDNTSSSVETTNNIKIDPLLPKSSMSSYLVGSGYQNIKKLQIWNRITPKERSLLNVFEILKRAVQDTKYEGKIFDDAKIFYYQIHTTIDSSETNKKKDVVSRGINRLGLIAYCLYVSCEKNNFLITLKEIYKMFNIDKNTFKCGRKKFLNLVSKFDINFNDEKQYYTIIDYVQRYLPHINLTFKEKYFCYLISKRIQMIDILKNKQPNSSAIGIIYFTIKHFNKQIPKSYLANLSSKSEPTISKIFYLISEYKYYIVPLNFDNVCLIKNIE